MRALVPIVLSMNEQTETAILFALDSRDFALADRLGASVGMSPVEVRRFYVAEGGDFYGDEPAEREAIAADSALCEIAEADSLGALVRNREESPIAEARNEADSYLAALERFRRMETAEERNEADRNLAPIVRAALNDVREELGELD